MNPATMRDREPGVERPDFDDQDGAADEDQRRTNRPPHDAKPTRAGDGPSGDPNARALWNTPTVASTIELEQAVHQLERQARTIAVLLVKRELDQLAAANGDVAEDRSHADTANGASATPTSGSRTCTLCGAEKPLGAFERHRAQCRDCRRERYDAKRREQANGEAPAAEAAPAYPPEPQPA
jgi:hypothetical protein